MSHEVQRVVGKKVTEWLNLPSGKVWGAISQRGWLLSCFFKDKWKFAVRECGRVSEVGSVKAFQARVDSWAILQRYCSAWYSQQMLSDLFLVLWAFEKREREKPLGWGEISLWRKCIPGNSYLPYDFSTDTPTIFQVRMILSHLHCDSNTFLQEEPKRGWVFREWVQEVALHFTLLQSWQALLITTTVYGR